MTISATRIGIAEGHDLREPRRKSAALLVAAAVLAPTLLIAGLATGAGWLLLLVPCVTALCVWSLADARASVLIAVLLCTFVDYNTGRLTPELAVVCVWLAWTALVLVWRSAWRGLVLPPREMLPGLGVWLAACALGSAVCLLRGNSLRNLGLELGAALWPAVGLGVMQIYGRRSLRYAGLGLVVIGLIHVGFGLTMLQIYHRRLGGIYFTTITGFVAVGLWIAAMLAPKRKTRILCLIAMIPMLAHLLFSFTRGYWLGFVAGLLLATVLAWRNLGVHEPAGRHGRLLLLPALLIVFIGTLAISVLYFGGENLLASAGGRFSSSFSTKVTPETLSNVIRLDEYDRAIGAALESPIIGRGFGFSFITRDLLTRTIREQWFVHNYYLLLWLKLGLVGVAAFGFLLWSWVRAASRLAARESDWLARVWAISAIAITVQVLVILITNYSLADVTTASVVGCLWGVFWSIRPPQAEDVST